MIFLWLKLSYHINWPNQLSANTALKQLVPLKASCYIKSPGNSTIWLTFHSDSDFHQNNFRQIHSTPLDWIQWKSPSPLGVLASLVGENQKLLLQLNNAETWIQAPSWQRKYFYVPEVRNLIILNLKLMFIITTNKLGWAEPHSRFPLGFPLTFPLGKDMTSQIFHF